MDDLDRVCQAFAERVERDLAEYTSEVLGVIEAYALQAARRRRIRRIIRWYLPLPVLSILGGL